MCGHSNLTQLDKSIVYTKSSLDATRFSLYLSLTVKYTQISSSANTGKNCLPFELSPLTCFGIVTIGHSFA